MIALDAVTVRRGGRALLDAVTLAPAPGRITAVLGPNGAGKSTLLAVAAGLVAPDEGRVLLDGAPVDRIAARSLARRRAYLPQRASVEWPIPVRRLVRLGLTPLLPAFGPAPRWADAHVEAQLAAYDLEALADRAATSLSGGELARAMLARASVVQAPLMIVDEPTADLDPRHALDAMTRLATLRTGGTTILVALHDVALALRVADDVALMKDGRLVDVRPAAAIDGALLSALYDMPVTVAEDGAVRFG